MSQTNIDVNQENVRKNRTRRMYKLRGKRINREGWRKVESTNGRTKEGEVNRIRSAGKRNMSAKNGRNGAQDTARAVSCGRSRRGRRSTKKKRVGSVIRGGKVPSFREEEYIKGGRNQGTNKVKGTARETTAVQITNSQGGQLIHWERYRLLASQNR
jgi:hypothetical protein